METFYQHNKSSYDFSINIAIAIFYLKKTRFIYNLWFCFPHTCYCVGMVSVTSASRYVTTASRYQSRSSMYIRGPTPRNSTDFRFGPSTGVPLAGVWNPRKLTIQQVLVVPIPFFVMKLHQVTLVSGFSSVMQRAI